jgi:hypothetical protein
VLISEGLKELKPGFISVTPLGEFHYHLQLVACPAKTPFLLPCLRTGSPLHSGQRYIVRLASLNQGAIPRHIRSEKERRSVEGP